MQLGRTIQACPTHHAGVLACGGWAACELRATRRCAHACCSAAAVVQPQRCTRAAGRVHGAVDRESLQASANTCVYRLYTSFHEHHKHTGALNLAAAAVSRLLAASGRCDRANAQLTERAVRLLSPCSKDSKRGSPPPVRPRGGATPRRRGAAHDCRLDELAPACLPRGRAWRTPRSCAAAAS